MGNDVGRKFTLEGPGRLATFCAAALLALILLIFLALEIYLATPLPARQLSRFITSTLQQEFTVAKVGLSGRSVVLRGIRLHSPKGFAGPDLVAADSVTVTPKWWDLLRGRRNFESISIEKGSIDLRKNPAGAWNFSELKRRLAAKKPPARPAPETVIGKLAVVNGSLSVQGEGVQGMNLKLFNLATGGSRSAQLDLVFQDPAGNSYHLGGTARPGGEAALDLSLSAPTLSLQRAAALFKLKTPEPFRKAGGSLAVTAVLAKGELRFSGAFRFRDIQLPAARGSYPVAGSLNFTGTYGLEEDRADLADATLEIKDVAQLHGEGSVSGVRKEREFALLFAVDRVDLALLNALLADKARGGLLYGGQLRCESLRVEGSAPRGVESATGVLVLEEGSLARGGETLVSGLSGKANVAGKGGGVALAGRLSAPQATGKALVEAVELPFDLILTPQLKPVRFESSKASARLMGIPATGDLAFDAARPEPISASLKIGEAKVSSLNPLLKRYGAETGTGVLSGTLAASGKGGSDFTATAKLLLSGVSAKRGKTSAAVKDGAVTAQFGRRAGRLQASGEARLAGLTLDGKGGDARLAYRVDGTKLTLEGVQGRLGDTRLAIARLSGELPPKGATGRTPLAWELEGGALRQGDLDLAGVAGRFSGLLVRSGEERWLEGKAHISTKSVTLKGKGIGAPALQAVFSREGGEAEVSGSLLGGKLAGQGKFRPFTPDTGQFSLSLTGAAAAQAAGFLKHDAATRPTGGEIDLRASGSYAGKRGLDCRFDIKGRNLSASKDGKRALSGGSLFLSGNYASGKLSIGEGLLSPGKGVALRVRGEVARAASPAREGSLTLSLPETPVDALVDTAINLMPQAIQEATLKGTLSGGGKLELRGGRQLLDGRLEVHGGGIDSPSQKLTISGIDGTLPVSMDFSAKAAPRPRDSREFSRGNYRRVLAELKGMSAGGNALNIDRISYGTLQLEKLALQLRASNGVMEVLPLRATLYKGAILGTGYLAMGTKANYRADLLVNGVSLKQLCGSIPSVQGYISGKVDGVISFRGTGGGIDGTAGFVELWAREGKDEKMLVSKEFLQRLAKQKLSGFFLSRDRPYDAAEIKATLQDGDLTFNTLRIVNTNFVGVKDLNVNIAPTQNRIGLGHLLESIREAAVRGKPATGEPEQKKGTAAPPPEAAPEFKWEE
ncbi:AsmA family protein [Geomonas oryzae]|uniref:AsmA family protein n=1 Tax=Geomonas oryzae TaxID=2364273 RepID=UPI00100A252F|nr:AsmA family protein [Geomonas oryzae]